MVEALIGGGATPSSAALATVEGQHVRLFIEPRCMCTVRASSRFRPRGTSVYYVSKGGECAKSPYLHSRFMFCFLSFIVGYAHGGAAIVFVRT